MDSQTAKKLEKKFTKVAAKTLGLRQKDVCVNHYGDGEFGLIIGHLGWFEFEMKDGTTTLEPTFSPDDLSQIENIVKLHPLK